MYAFNPFIINTVKEIIYPAVRVASYSFDNGNATDLIGGSNGISSGVDFSQIGKIGQCAYFDGNASIIIPNTLPSPGNVGFTFSCFFKTLQTINKYVFYRQSNNDNHNSFLSITIGSAVSLGVRGTNGIYASIDSNNKIINDNIWHHAAITVNCVTGVICIYIDGVFNKTITTSPMNIVFDSKASVGEWLHDWEGSSGGPKNIGYLDEVNIWNRALTQSEIIEISGL